MTLVFYRAKKKIENEIKKVFDNSSDKILDIGCGINPWYHQIIKGSLTRFDIIDDKNHIDVTGSMEHLPFEDESFDKIISINALYFSSEPKKAFAEIARVLKKDGKTFLVTPFMHPIHHVPHDKYRFSEYAFVSLFPKNVIDMKIIPVRGIFSLPLMLVHSLIKGIPLLFAKSLKK